MSSAYFHTRRLILSYGYEAILTLCFKYTFIPLMKALKGQAVQEAIHPPKTPEDFAPLSRKNFENPYPYYRMLRDEYPVYKMPGQDYYLIARYADIVEVTRNTEAYSSRIVEIIASGRPKPAGQTRPTLIERLGSCGVIPVDVLATQDPPVHPEERKIGHSGFNARFVKSLEPEVENLCDSMLDEWLPSGRMDFVEAFAWQLPLRLIIRLLGIDEKHTPKIKQWCMDGIATLSGTATRAEMVAAGASVAGFIRFLWREYLKVKANPEQYPKTCFTRTLACEARQSDSIMTDQRAVSTLFQLLIAGSDSSASSMGAAVKLIAENPSIEQTLRNNPEKIDDFIEEVFRMESAFQGHFRVTTTDITLHGQKLPADTRLFLLWGSANRDERFWDDPDSFIIGRKKGKKHLTFGHGIHACIGRELARMEIRIVIARLLARTENLSPDGSPTYEASIFTRTLKTLPITWK